MEAMAVGVPVVTTWIAGIPELAEAGVTALTVPPARADALADALRRLADDASLRQRLSLAARARVEEQHDQDRCGAIVARQFKSAASL
jgi:glycosyltransferase involved in cell wall biosynthesis